MISDRSGGASRFCPTTEPVLPAPARPTPRPTPVPAPVTEPVKEPFR